MRLLSFLRSVAALFAAVLLLQQTVHAWPFDPPFTLPATGTVKYLLAITTKALPRAPKPPNLYRGRTPPRRPWAFKGGAGTLMVASYSKAAAPIGPYSELVYIPGKYAPCSNNRSLEYDSVSRIWVDSNYSLEVGRYMGGMPKYMANFKWHVDPTTGKLVNVSAHALNKTILRITGLKQFSSFSNAADAYNEAETAAMVQFTQERFNVQWPIYPPNTPKPATDVPLIGNQQFDTGIKSPESLKADSVYVDPLVFTGSADLPVVYDKSIWILSAPAGTTGTVMPHTNLTCA